MRSMTAQAEVETRPEESSARQQLASSLKRLLKVLTVLIAWMGSMILATQIGQWIGPVEFNFCGPWGCTASGNDLAGYHAFWLALVALPVIAAACCLPIQTAKRVGWVVFLLGLVGICILVLGTSVHWILTVSPERRSYWLQRGFFMLVDSSDFPVTQVCLAGLIALAIVTLRRLRRPRAASLSPITRASDGDE